MEVLTYEAYTFFEVLAFQIMCIIACKLHSLDEVAAHYIMSISYLLIYFGYVSISHSVNKELSVSIEDISQVDGIDMGIKSGKKKVSLGVLLALTIALAIVFNIEVNR
jgi:hypothetical protein